MQRKKVSIFLIIAFSIICLWKQGYAKEVSLETTVHYYTQKVFSIQLPNNWDKQQGLNKPAFVATAPLESHDDNFRENINIVVEELPSETSLSEYYLANIRKREQVLTDFVKHQEGQTTLNNRETTWLIYSHKMGTLNLKVLTYVLLNKHQGYIITFSAATDQFSKYKDEFLDIAQSFKFE